MWEIRGWTIERHSVREMKVTVTPEVLGDGGIIVTLNVKFLLVDF